MAKDGLAVVNTQSPDQAKNLIEELEKGNSINVDLLVNANHHGVLLPTTICTSESLTERVDTEKIALDYSGAAHTDIDSFVCFENTKWRQVVRS